MPVLWNKSCPDQGDQIGRIFACRVIIYFRQAWENYRSSRYVSTFYILFLRKKFCILHFDKKWVGPCFGRFFSQTNLVTLFPTQSFPMQTQVKKCRKECVSQGCQTVFIFEPKIPIWVNFGGPYIGKRWYILWPFGIFYGNWGYFMTIWYILCSFSGFVVMYHEKSGNPECDCANVSVGMKQIQAVKI
jgi:hypothetical protein